MNPYEHAWNRARDEAWSSDSSEAWFWAPVCADRAAMAASDPREIELWVDRLTFASDRARRSVVFERV